MCAAVVAAMETALAMEEVITQQQQWTRVEFAQLVKLLHHLHLMSAEEVRAPSMLLEAKGASTTGLNRRGSRAGDGALA